MTRDELDNLKRLHEAANLYGVQVKTLISQPGTPNEYESTHLCYADTDSVQWTRAECEYVVKLIAAAPALIAMAEEQMGINGISAKCPNCGMLAKRVCNHYECECGDLFRKKVSRG